MTFSALQLQFLFDILAPCPGYCFATCRHYTLPGCTLLRMLICHICLGLAGLPFVYFLRDNKQYLRSAKVNPALWLASFDGHHVDAITYEEDTCKAGWVKKDVLRCLGWNFPGSQALGLRGAV